MLLAEQIQGDMPQRHHIFRRMILADATTIFMKGHIERPMECMLNMPMLADQDHKGRSRPYQACNRDAIVTGGRGTRVGGANGFDDNHGAEIRPCG